MKRREVIFAPEAHDDLAALYDWIADAAGANVAMGYVERLEAWCLDFDLASERACAKTSGRVCALSASNDA